VARRSTVRSKGVTAVASTTTTTSPAFVKVALPTQTLSTQTLRTIDVLLAQGRRLRVRRGFDADLLRQLLRVLEEPAC
jgi:hypothetical protein